ncbi:SPOR domain-containing protein [Microbulbifer sp. YPW1]|uniref:SPOR domain-containing protein n=1 Tax=Microbulbifer sp. YPW1 TaxID=2745199 RepID=UPI00159755C6|nr:hypothetical protein [Microbulbifer sp. YPW1]QKX16035.1 hypothetical protein HUW35_02925 [Microbulbifer sp. YPW1]
MRWIFILLAVANLGLFAWFLSNDRPTAARVTPVIAAEEGGGISLVTEADPAALPAPEPPSKPERSAVPARNARGGAEALCTMVGPFAEAYQGEDVARRLQALEINAAMREIEMQGQMRYWVYLAPLNSSQEAFRKLRELQAAGIDSYVIPKGSLENGISFGIFSEKDRAETLTGELQDRGFAAQFREEPQTYLERWVVLAEREGASGAASLGEDFWGQLQLDYPDIGRRQNLCSEIRTAQEE